MHTQKLMSLCFPMVPVVGRWRLLDMHRLMAILPAYVRHSLIVLCRPKVMQLDHVWCWMTIVCSLMAKLDVPLPTFLVRCVYSMSMHAVLG